MHAIFNPTRTHRLALFRGIPGRSVMFLGVNPSIAAESVDDATSRVLWGFTERWGFDSYWLGNLYGAVSTNPKNLSNFVDPIGEENDYYIDQMARRSVIAVACWGGCPFIKPDRVERVVNIVLKKQDRLFCFGTTKNGSPKHPLYLPRNTPLQLYRETT